MQVRILKSFPYITPHNRELVHLTAGEIVDVDASHVDYAHGWIKAGMAEMLEGPKPEPVKPETVEGEPEPVAERVTKARKPKTTK